MSNGLDADTSFRPNAGTSTGVGGNAGAADGLVAFRATDDGRVTRRFYVRGGFAEVTPEGLTILSEAAVDLAAIDRASLLQDIRNTEEDAAGARDEAVRLAAAEQLVYLRAIEAAL